MEPGSEITIEIEEGKSLIIKFLTISEAHPDGTRTVFFELNGQPREVTVLDKSLKVESSQRAKADPEQSRARRRADSRSYHVHNRRTRAKPSKKAIACSSWKR